MHKILLDNFLKEVLQEDIGRGDLYTRMKNDTSIEAYVLAREEGVLSAAGFHLAQISKSLPADGNYVVV